MAELLFNLKDKFDIIDVEFPKIPGDVIYNADKATYKTDTGDGMGDMEQSPVGDDEFDPSAPLDLSDLPPDEDGAEGMDAEGGEGDLGDEFTDDASVEDFPDDMADTGSSESSILAKVIDMLKAQAESEVEKAKASAEQARAEQARYTAQATQFAIKDQEEQLRYELEMDEQKKKEKDARRMADMAKHKISKTMSSVNGMMSEADEGATPSLVMRQRQLILQRFAIQPNDSVEVRAYKNKQRQAAMREWKAKYEQALNTQNFEREMQDQEKAMNDPRNQNNRNARNPNPNPNPNPNQNPNQNPNPNPNPQNRGNPANQNNMNQGRVV
jgi:hypothetical protein